MATPFEVIQNPEAHGHEECGHCHGYGSSLSDPGDTRCTVCGGSGVVPKTTDKPDYKANREARLQELEDLKAKSQDLMYETLALRHGTLTLLENALEDGSITGFDYRQRHAALKAHWAAQDKEIEDLLLGHAAKLQAMVAESDEEARQSHLAQAAKYRAMAAEESDEELRARIVKTAEDYDRWAQELEPAPVEEGEA